jgi:hypothetical protein
MMIGIFDLEAQGLKSMPQMNSSTWQCIEAGSSYIHVLLRKTSGAESKDSLLPRNVKRFDGSILRISTISILFSMAVRYLRRIHEWHRRCIPNRSFHFNFASRA